MIKNSNKNGIIPVHDKLLLSHNAEIPSVFPFLYSLPSSIKGLYLYDIRQYEYCLPCIYCAHRNHSTSLLNYCSETYLSTPDLGVDLSSLLQIRSYVKFRRRDSTHKLKPHRRPTRLVKLSLPLTPNLRDTIPNHVTPVTLQNFGI